MSARILHCPNCGDLWKRIRYERFVRLGAPLRQCRACNSWHDSHHAEWPTLKLGQKLAFLAQNIFLVLPLALLFFCSALGSQFLGIVPVYDLLDYSVFAGLVLLGLLALLMIRSAVQAFMSVKRFRRGAAQAARRQSVGGKFISDIAWQASVAARPRFPAPHAPASAKLEQHEIAGESRFLHPA